MDPIPTSNCASAIAKMYFLQEDLDHEFFSHSERQVALRMVANVPLINQDKVPELGLTLKEALQTSEASGSLE